MCIYIHFGGFYHYHDDYINTFIESLGYDFEEINFNLIYIEYAKKWLQFFNKETGQKLQFIEIVSPMYYNFTTDVINATILITEAEKLKNEYLKNAEFLKYANDKIKPRDGYISYYKNIDNLIKLSKVNNLEDEVLTGLIIDFVTLKNDINGKIFEDFYQFMEDVEMFFNDTETATN